ncbi:MAG: hypothetical protein AVDCRST_MAG01-01-2305, partial [uncultured Rubrobacteraceae bacterium]
AVRSRRCFRGGQRFFGQVGCDSGPDGGAVLLRAPDHGAHTGDPG